MAARTESKQRQDKRFRQEDLRALTDRLIIKIGSPENFRTCLWDLLSALQGWIGCDAIGIRLKDEFDYPYYETKGFPHDFVEKERSLCCYNASGELMRDKAGNPILECMCGNVICGRSDSSKPFFTPKGSFFSNCTTELLASTTDEDRMAHTRNRCNGQGYESVALIPIRSEGKVYGLIQLNTKKRDSYTSQMISAVEYLSDNLAMAIAGRYALEELLEKDRMYHSLFENMINGFAYCQMIYAEGQAKDFIYIAVNKAFEKQTGFVNVTGKRITEILPDFEKTDRELLEIYGRVAQSGIPERFEIYVNGMKMWFDVSVYSPSRNYFIAVFEVITARKENEEKLKRDLEEKEILLREIHHRVKNNLNIVSSLLDIQSMDVKDKEDAAAAFKKSQDRIYAMALVHEELYSKFEGLSNVDMHAYLNQLCGDLRQVYGPGVEIQVSTNDIYLDVEYAGPIGLIVNELVTNSMKHAFKDKEDGVISISMARNDDKALELTVSDNGRGFIEKPRMSSVGLTLVTLLVDQLRGSMKLESNNGAVFYARFPGAQASAGTKTEG